MGLVSSLLLLAPGPWPVQAAERLEVEIDGVVLPVTVKELSGWVRSKGRRRSELNTWLMLLDPASRAGLIRLLQAPVLTRRSLGQQMLRSWAAGPLVDAVGALVRLDGDAPISSEQVLSTMESLLLQQETLSTLDLLEALPSERLRLDLDALVQAASRWRDQMRQHQRLTASLADVSVSALSLPADDDADAVSAMRTFRLPAAHRPDGLPVQVWTPLADQRSTSDSSWLLLMPGLGGDPEHLHWLAQACRRGMARRHRGAPRQRHRCRPGFAGGALFRCFGSAAAAG